MIAGKARFSVAMVMVAVAMLLLMRVILIMVVVAAFVSVLSNHPEFCASVE